MNIEKIVGKKNYARLKKAGISEPDKLKIMSEEEVMQLAGIGPKTAKKLFKSLGRNIPEPILTKKYNRLQFRTRLKNIRMGMTKAVEDPTSVINKIEKTKKTAHLLQNFLAAVANIDREGSPVPQIPYVRAPTDFDLETFKRSRSEVPEYVGELRLMSEHDGVIMKYSKIDQETGDRFDSTDKIKGSIREQASEILSEIKDIYDKFRESSQSYFIIIFDEKTNSLLDTIQDTYRYDIQKEKMILVEDETMYYQWESLYKYKNNPEIDDMIKNLEQHINYYNYETAGEPGDYEEYERKTPPDLFWNTIDTTRTSTTQKPYIEFKAHNKKIRFGIIQGMQDLNLYDFQKQGYREYSSIIPPTHYDAIENYSAFKDARKGMPINLGPINLPLDLYILVDSTLNHNYTIYEYKKESPLIIVSKEYPDIGFVIY
jgi:hypothetical protein